MKAFDNIEFLGTFRPYQQRVLDSSKKYLKNSKIHIVAAPGSGKTILGLELIRRLNSPCIVLSPTNTIRYQWGDRFESMFLPKGCNIDDYVSFDLNNIKPITSITYQALHSAIDKIACVDEDNVTIDYTNIDMFKLINEYKITTICVDEAHHLQNKWQKALEKFIKGISDDVKIIALTATPPYDAEPNEWQRYIDTCGEIDEEIFVTELVKAKNLCPHQDYIYLNYPTEQESLILNNFKQNIITALDNLKNKEYITKLPARLWRMLNFSKISNLRQYIDIYTLLKKLNITFEEKNIKDYFNIKDFPQNLAIYESALNILIKEDILSVDDKEDLVNYLKRMGLIDHSKVSLQTNSKIEKELLYSLGKMESIINIVDCETETLQSDLRLLILTDYIRKKDLSKIGTNELFEDISIISIFENIRRHTQTNNLAILSGELVILPSNLQNDVENLLKEKSTKLSTKPLNNTGYCEYIFRLSNKEKVNIVGQLFEEGKINIIVGTKSLLGEGWDSPCINSLIMASFVGSFMLSNQMRGRAIRVYKNDPNKTANIWHLVTLEPENSDTNQLLDCNEETSADYKTVKRRFNCFVGPHYTNKSIESGIDRISILKDSYNKASVLDVNTQMITLAKDRQNLVHKWDIVDHNSKMVMQCRIPIDRVAKTPAILSLFKTLTFGLIFFLTAFVLPFATSFIIIQSLSFFASFIFGVITLLNLVKTIKLISPKCFIQCLVKQLKKAMEFKKFITEDGKLIVKRDKKYILVSIDLENIKEQNVFLYTLKQILSPIDNPRYILRSTFLQMPLYKYCYQIPTLFDNNNKNATIFKDFVGILAPNNLIYSNNKTSKDEILNCEIYQYIKNSKTAITLKQVSCEKPS